jgi:hypothetical protein
MQNRVIKPDIIETDHPIVVIFNHIDELGKCLEIISPVGNFKRPPIIAFLHGTGKYIGECLDIIDVISHGTVFWKYNTHCREIVS